MVGTRSFPFGMADFQGQAVSFREGKLRFMNPQISNQNTFWIYHLRNSGKWRFLSGSATKDVMILVVMVTRFDIYKLPCKNTRQKLPCFSLTLISLWLKIDSPAIIDMFSWKTKHRQICGLLQHMLKALPDREDQTMIKRMIFAPKKIVQCVCVCVCAVVMQSPLNYHSSTPLDSGVVEYDHCSCFSY